ncbi:uncharacterized protein UTRI_10547 [Ustilago trichophora]|uniref:Effector family protein Eff1 n=1 Tax=Ustilago trichophora TaxID=86804 RepID=A0A5C3EB78_9BASI|nr:uncharacterized protein UTRI_10547 [Ustilago trichophora]
MVDLRFQLKGTWALLPSLIASCIVTVTSRPAGGSSPSGHGSGLSGISDPGFHWQQSPSSSPWTPDHQAVSQSSGIKPLYGPSNFLGHDPAWNDQGQGSFRPPSRSERALNYAPVTTFPTVGPIAEHAPTNALRRHWDLLTQIGVFQDGSRVSNSGGVPPSLESHQSSALPLTTMEQQTQQPKHQPAPTTDGHLSFSSDDKNTIERWKERLRKATGSALEVSAVNPASVDPKVFVARYSNLEGDDVGSRTASQEALAGPVQGYQTGHFVGRLRDVFSMPLQYGITDNDRERRYVYLNSRQHEAYLNEKYFIKHMTFLPLDPKMLTQKLLNDLYGKRRSPKILPPIKENGFPLILLSHDSGRKLREIERATGKLSSDLQIVSLWSPLLVDKFHQTVILYGFGQLKNEGILDTADYLKTLAKDWDNKNIPLSSSYYFSDDFLKPSSSGVHIV